MNREFDALADDFVTLGLLPAGSDKTEITPALTGVFQDALANGVNNLNFGDLSGNLGQTMYQYNFRIPPYYTLLVRSLSVLEVSQPECAPMLWCLLYVTMCCAVLGWAGLGWAGLGCAVLGWAGLGWAGLGWAVLCCAVLCCAVLQLNCAVLQVKCAVLCLA